MKSIILRTALLAAALTTIAALDGGPVSSSERRDDQQGPGKREWSRDTLRPLNQRALGGPRKLIVQVNEEARARVLASAGVTRISEYGSYLLLELTDEALATLDSAILQRSQLRDDFNLLMLKGGTLDTRGTEPDLPTRLRQQPTSGASLRLAQLFGPPTRRTVAALRASGARIVSYVPNNAYLVWANPAQLGVINGLQEVQWIGDYHPGFKLGPGIDPESVEQIPLSVTVLDQPAATKTIERIESLARRVLMREGRMGPARNIKILAEMTTAAEIATMPDVLSVEPWDEIRLKDERANQIVAGALNDENLNNRRIARPTGPGYLVFLNSKGLGAGSDVAVDVADSGFDLGTGDVRRIHPDFLSASGESRIVYQADFTGDTQRHGFGSGIFAAHDALGHGTINASIIAGMNLQAGPGIADAAGFQYGLGVAPHVRLGISKLFDDDGVFRNTTPFSHILGFAWNSGARVSSNSWGLCIGLTGFCNFYNDDARAYDALVRDADLNAPGNQEMVVVFAAGNDGHLSPRSISMPGTAKNVITVGASEGFRPTDDNGNPLLDGCGIGATLADNAQDVAVFSSTGPTQDGRSKPDIVAPGTHITGAATQDSFFHEKSVDDIGTCDHSFPANQHLYTWSSGTSHSTPIVAGGAALAFQWLTNTFGREPSAALVKAFLLNSASYLGGAFGGDNLPGIRQGWGLMNLAHMFEDIPRIVYDQDPDRTFADSGGTPFEVTGLVADPSREFRVMLVYTDAAGSSATNAPYVNQLNLEVIAGGKLYSANRFDGPYSIPGRGDDFLNNVQGIRLPAGTTGPFVIRVKPTLIAGDGVPGNDSDLDQDFALVATNAMELPLPILTVAELDDVSQGVTVRMLDGTSVEGLVPGETSLITVTLTNESLVAQSVPLAATLALPGLPGANGVFPPVPEGGSATTEEPFSLHIPSHLRCGSVFELQLRLDTGHGLIVLPVRIRVGRPADDLVLLEDDVDSELVKWKLKKGFVRSSAEAFSGFTSYHAVDQGLEFGGNAKAPFAKLKKGINIPANAGRVRLSFLHIFDFEPGYDGGILEITTGGQVWEDLGSRVMVGGYDGKVTEMSENPLGNRFAWTSRGRTGTFSQVVINLDDFAGKRIKLRFTAGFDDFTGFKQGYTGWFIDDVRITATRFVCP